MQNPNKRRKKRGFYHNTTTSLHWGDMKPAELLHSTISSCENLSVHFQYSLSTNDGMLVHANSVTCQDSSRMKQSQLLTRPRETATHSSQIILTAGVRAEPATSAGSFTPLTPRQLHRQSVSAHEKRAQAAHAQTNRLRVERN